MKKLLDKNMIYIIGDSHTLRLRNSVPFSQTESCSWIKNIENKLIPGTSKCREPHAEKSFFKKTDREIIYSKEKIENEIESEVYFFGIPGTCGYASTYTNGEFPCFKKEINENTVILPWYGYIDIKSFLPIYKNPEESVLAYINKTINFFKGYKIKFVEPLPQFINILGTGYPNYEFETRYSYYLEYLYFLRKHLREYGFEPPISVENILGVDKFDDYFECHDCDDCLSLQFKDYKLDHLKKEFNKKVLDELIRTVV